MAVESMPNEPVRRTAFVLRLNGSKIRGVDQDFENP
jgi:hypothetical protein